MLFAVVGNRQVYLLLLTLIVNSFELCCIFPSLIRIWTIFLKNLLSLESVVAWTEIGAPQFAPFSRMDFISLHFEMKEIKCYKQQGGRGFCSYWDDGIFVYEVWSGGEAWKITRHLLLLNCKWMEHLFQVHLTFFFFTYTDSILSVSVTVFSATWWMVLNWWIPLKVAKV